MLINLNAEGFDLERVKTATTETAVSQATHEKQGSCQNCYCSQSAQTAKAF